MGLFFPALLPLPEGRRTFLRIIRNREIILPGDALTFASDGIALRAITKPPSRRRPRSGKLLLFGDYLFRLPLAKRITPVRGLVIFTIKTDAAAITISPTTA